MQRSTKSPLRTVCMYIMNMDTGCASTDKIVLKVNYGGKAHPDILYMFEMEFIEIHTSFIDKKTRLPSTILQPQQ